jgi:Protein of unknown function (DUF3108)
MRSLVLTAVLTSTIALGAEAQRAFGPGELATYAVSYLGLPAGEAQVMVGNPTEQHGPDVWPIVCTAKSTNLATTLRIRDKFVTWWDDKNMRTLGNELFADEFHTRRHTSIRFGTPEGTAQVTRRHEDQPARESEWDVEQGTMDVAAAAMVLRNTPLAVDTVVSVPVFTGNRNMVMRAKVVAKEKLDTALGEKEAWKLSVTSDFAGKLAGKRDMTLYLSADTSRVPLKVDAEFLLGNVTMELVKYQPGLTPRGGR